MATGQTYDKAFKMEAVRLVRTSGKSMRQIAEDLGVSNGTLSKWCQDAETNGERAFVGSGHQQPEAEELKRLRREMEILRQERDILKKSACHLFACVEDRFLFIECHREDYEVRIMCRVLEVSVSGFYAWRKRPVSAREREDGELVERIVEIFQDHRGVYGSPRIHEALRDEGIHVGRKRVVRLMQHVRLSAHCRTHRVVTTRANPLAQPADNVLDRDFHADAPNTKWVADVTYVRTASGWLYLAAVLHLFSRRVVGWAMDAIFDTSLVERALSMAVTQRKPGAGLLHHSDRGCQYTSEAYQRFLKEQQIQVSMSRKGNCWDNAVMERFFGTLKRECTSREHFKTLEEARTTIFEYIEAFYNRIRKHSTLGYLSPVQFEIVHS